MSPNNSLSKKDLTLMLFNYQAERIITLEKTQKWLITTLVVVLCAFSGVQIGVI